MQAISARRRGVRLVVIGLTQLTNVSQLLESIPSSELDYYRYDNLRNFNGIADQLARDICATLRAL